MSKVRIPDSHKDYVQEALIVAAGCGPLGSFCSVADVTSIAGIWGGMLYRVASWEGVSMDKETAIKICKSALLGMGGYYAGCKAATKAFLLIPGAGILIAMGASTLANVLFTYRFALTICPMFYNKAANSLGIGELACNIKSMYAGNGIADDAMQIVDIMVNG